MDDPSFPAPFLPWNASGQTGTGSCTIGGNLVEIDGRHLIIYMKSGEQISTGFAAGRG